jgi:hypothetical protein
MIRRIIAGKRIILKVFQENFDELVKEMTIEELLYWTEKVFDNQFKELHKIMKYMKKNMATKDDVNMLRARINEHGERIYGSDWKIETNVNTHLN